MRKENHVADAFLPEQHDAQAINANADAARWRHAVFECHEKIFIKFLLLAAGLLLEAFALLNTPELALVFAGGETLFDYRDYRCQFDRRAAELGIEPIVLGTVDNDDLPFLLAQASVLPFFSTKEGFGLAAMEALAAGTPVVARDLPVLREVFGETVAYAADHVGMSRSLAAALDRRHDGAAGRALARSLTWDAAAQRHLEFYRSVG